VAYSPFSLPWKGFFFVSLPPTTNFVLVREKKRAVWSLAIGAVLAALIYGYTELQMGRIDTQLLEAVRECQATPKAKNGYPIIKDFDDKGAPGEFIVGRQLHCAPEDARLTEDSLLDPERKVRDLASQEEQSESNQDWVYVVFVFALPGFWYFLLDRIGEISAAISGRNQAP
jgi:hypothetical protein